MNAKDLAALAALGIGGAYLYNRNKKSDDDGESRKSRDFDAVEPEVQMPAYQGRTADRLADIQNEYGKAPAADMGTEGRRTSMAIAPAAKKPAARPAAPAAQVAAPETPAGNPKLNSILDTNIYKDSQRRKAALASEEANNALFIGDIGKGISMEDTKAYMDNQRAKAAERSKEAKATFAKGDAAKVNSLRAAADARKQAAAKKAEATANSQAIIDRISTRTRPYMKDEPGNDMKRGGAVKKMASGGKVSSASSRGDGIAQRGKTRGKMY